MNLFPKGEQSKASEKTLALAQQMQSDIDQLQNPSEEIDGVVSRHFAIEIRNRVEGMSPEERAAFLAAYFDLEEAKAQLAQDALAADLAEKRTNIPYEVQKYRRLHFNNVQMGQVVQLYLCDPAKKHTGAGIDLDTIYKKWVRRIEMEATATPGTFEVITDEMHDKYSRLGAFSLRQTVEIGWLMSSPDRGTHIEPAVYLNHPAYMPPIRPHESYRRITAQKQKGKGDPIDLVVGQVVVDDQRIFPLLL